MAIDISSLAIQIKSEGITNATQDLRELASSAKTATTSVGAFVSASNSLKSSVSGLSASLTSAVSGSNAYANSLSVFNSAANLAAQAQSNFHSSLTASSTDIAGLSANLASIVAALKEVEQTQKAAAKAAADSAKQQLREQSALNSAMGQALEMNKRMDWKRLGQDQSEALKINKAMTDSVNSMNTAHGQALDINKRMDWKRLGQDQSEALKINKAMTDSVNSTNAAHGQALEMNKKFDWKKLGQDQSEALKINKAMNKSHQEAIDTLKNMNGHGSIWNNTLKSMAVAASAYIGVNFAKSIIEQADAWGQMESKLKIATGSTEAAKIAQQGLFEVAQKIRIPLADSVQLFTRMSLPMQLLGKSSKETMGVVEGMGLALKLSGATAQEASSVMLQFSQSMNSGKLNGQEFNAVAEGAPIILRAIEAELRRTGQGAELASKGLKKMGSDGKITSEIMTSAILNARVKMENDFNSLPLTVDGALVRIKNAWQAALGSIAADTKFNEKMAEALKSLEAYIPSFAKTVGNAFAFIVQNASAIATAIELFAGAASLALIGNFVGSVYGIGKAFITVGGGVEALSKAMMGLGITPWGAAFVALGLAVWGVAEAYKSLADAADKENERVQKRIESSGNLAAAMVAETKELKKQVNLMREKAGMPAVYEDAEKFTTAPVLATETKAAINLRQAKDDLAISEQKLAKYTEESNNILKSSVGISDAAIQRSMKRAAQAEAEVAANRKQVAYFEGDLKRTLAAMPERDAAKDVEVAQAKINTTLELRGKIKDSLVTKDEKEIAKLQDLIDKAKKINETNSAAKVPLEEIAKLEKKIAEIREKDKETFKKTSLGYDQKAKQALEEIKQAYEDLQKYGVDDKRTAGEKQLVKLNAELTANLNRRTEATKNGTLAQLKQEEAIIRSAIATEKLVIAEEKRYNTKKDELKQNQEEIDAAEKTLEQATKEADVLEQAIQNHGKLAKSKEEVNLEYALEKQAILSVQADKEKQLELNAKTIEQLQRTIEYRKQLDEQAMTDKAAKKYEADWQAANKKIGDGLYEALSSNGTSFVKKLVKDMKEWFARLVLSPIIQPVASFGASLLNPMAASAMGAGASGSGGIGQITSLASLGKSIYDGFASGFSNLTAGYSSFATSSAGQFLGLGTGATMDMEAFSAAIANGSTAAEAQLIATQAGTQALTGFGQAVGLAGSYLAGITGGLTAGKAISGKYSIGGINSVNTGTAVGGIAGALGSLGSIGGPLGALLGGAVGGLVNRAFGMGNKEVTGARIAGTLGTSDISRNVSWKQDGGWFRSDRSGTDITKLATSSTDDQTLLKYLNDTYAALKTSTQDYAKALGINAESIATRSDKISVAVGKTAEESQANIVKMFKDLNDSMAQSLMGGLTNILKEGESAADGFARLAVEVTSVDAVVKGLGLTFSTGSMQVFQTADAAFSKFVNYTTEQLVTMKDALLQASGGLEAFLSQSAYFAQNFLSEAEKIKPSQDQVAKIFDQFHITNVTTIEDYKKLVQGIDLSTESGRAMYAALMLLAPTFKQVADYSGSAADGTARLAEELANTNKSIQDQIDALLKSSMTTEQIRAAELTGVDASTAALLRRLYALQDEKAATEAASAAMEAAASRARAIADERYGLETQLLQEEGKTDELRKRELDKLDPSNQELQKRIWALQDEKAATAAKVAADQKAAEEASRAAEQAANAAKAVRDAWQSITNTIMDEVRRIRGLVDESSSMGFAEAQSKFATTTAQARAGDQEAAKLLPSLSQALLTLAEKNARTAEELSYIRAMTANSLAQTATGYSGTYGVSLPSFDVGTDSVPHDMIAQIHAGEEIVPAAYTGKNNSELVTEIKSLKEEVSKMRTESNAQQQAIAISSAKTAKILTQNDFGQGILVTTSLPV